MRLPELDPAGSPRVAQNPYVPRLGVPAKRHVAEAPASACAKSAPSLGSTHEDAAGSGSQLFESAFTSHSVHGPELSGVTRAALGASPRSQALSDTAARLVQRKRLERLHDSYQTALSRETLLSEQYDKDLGAIRENLAKLASNQPADRAKAEVASQVRTRAKLERRVSGFEEKLNELDTYNGKLVGMISALRKQAEPHHHAEKRAKEALAKLTTGMAAQKAACHKALDERERMVDMIKHVQEDSYREENEFRNQIEMLKRDSDDLDVHNRQAEARMSAAEEFAKRQQCASMRTNRVHKERLEVRYGYLRSQLEGVDNDFRELQRIVGVHFQPSHPESLEQIIKKFVEKEGQVISLQRYFSLQSDEIELLLSQLARLTREEEAARATTRAAEAEAEAAASSGSKRAPYEDTDNVAQLERRFDEACCSIGRMFDDASCGTEPSGMHLATRVALLRLFTTFFRSSPHGSTRSSSPPIRCASAAWGRRRRSATRTRHWTPSYGRVEKAPPKLRGTAARAWVRRRRVAWQRRTSRRSVTASLRILRATRSRQCARDRRRATLINGSATRQSPRG